MDALSDAAREEYLYARAVMGREFAAPAVIEAAILVSRLHMLPREKIEAEIGYLEAAIEKTAGARETEAWVWLMEAVRAHFARKGQSAASNHPFS